MKKKGFTLIELVVVILIIGILAMIVVPRFFAMQDTANMGTFEANHRIVVSAFGMYLAVNKGAKPGVIGDLSPFLNDTAIAGRPSGATYTVSATGVTSTWPNSAGVVQTLTYKP